MIRSGDLEVDVLRIASGLPKDTVVIIGKIGTLKVHSVLRGRKEVLDTVMGEAEEIYDLFEAMPEEPQ